MNIYSNLFGGVISLLHSKQRGDEGYDDSGSSLKNTMCLCNAYQITYENSQAWLTDSLCYPSSSGRCCSTALS